MEQVDVAVIGAGLLGCFVARELSRWKLDILLLEAREDVCTGISRANTAVVYPGYDHKPGTLKAEMTGRANAAFGNLCEELDVPFDRCGSLMLSYGERADAVLRKKYQQGLENQVPDLRLLTAAEAYRMEPGLAPGLHAALWAPTAGTVNPWQLGIAACENAQKNGVRLQLKTQLVALHKESDRYLLSTNGGKVAARAVVNCAGLAADRIQKLLFPCEVKIITTAGDYLVLDRVSSGKPTHILEYEPEEKKKGLTFVPTTEGSVLIGPSERENRDDYASNRGSLLDIRNLAGRILPDLDLERVIRSFAAARPNPQYHDGRSVHSFVIDHPEHCFWSLIGIKTPGLTCARELGVYIAQRLTKELEAEINPDFEPVRSGIRKAAGRSFEQRAKLVEENPDYGEIVCVCEDVSRAEVLEAVRRGAITVDGVKRRVGTGMGRCQGTRCQRQIEAILSRELGKQERDIEKDGPGSRIVRDVREDL